MSDPLGHDRYPCSMAGCRCTHREPCDRGWIEVWQDDKLKGVKPCPTCDPERAEIIMFSDSRIDMMRKLQDRSRSARRDAYEREEGERTRTL